MQIIFAFKHRYDDIFGIFYVGKSLLITVLDQQIDFISVRIFHFFYVTWIFLIFLYRYFSAIERVIELFKVTDKDSGENGRVTFSIGGSAAEFLNIDSTDGILRTKSNANKTNGDYDLEVIAMDNGSTRKQTTTSVTVTVAKQEKKLIQFTQQEINMTVNENRPISSQLERVSSKVRNTDSVTLKFEIIDSRLDLAFAVNQDSGMVTLSKSVDRETTDIHKFVVSVKKDNDPTQSDFALVSLIISA